MNRNVLIIGDTILDEYINIDPIKVSDEAHVITSNISSKKYVLGGATNVARNVSTLGGQCFYIGLTSNQVNENLTKLLKHYEIDSFLINVDNAVQIKTRITSTRGAQVCRYDSQFVKHKLTSEQIHIIIDKINKLISRYDVIILSKYYKHFLTKNIVDQIMEISKRNNKIIIVDNRDDDYDLFSFVDFYKVNFLEFKQLFPKISIQNTNDDIVKTVNQFGFPFKHLIVTRSNLPTIFFSKNGNHYSHVIVDVNNVEVKDVSGAGDTFVASFALNFNEDFVSCIEKCHEICNVVVRKMGTNVVWSYEVNDYTDIALLCEQLKRNNRRIVFTNGVFDILHSGHVKILAECKKHADYLIVGINSDDSVKKLKGPTRPINSQEDRKKVLESIKYVDKVIIFDDITCERIIKEIKPNVYIKGGDYNLDNLPEKSVLSYIDEIIFVTLEDGKSTTSIINKATDKKWKKY